MNPVLQWVTAHPGEAGAVVFLIAFSESLALVGLFMPGALLMFAVGALIGAGSLGFWTTVAWAAAGAVLGDGVSFWLGRRYHQQLKGLWPFRTHPQLVARATEFFVRHGGKSVLLGRFLGPVRPVIPAIAGMMEMPIALFLATNLLSALLWAPAYLAPGVVFGASLDLAGEVAGRLALLLVLLLALVVGLAWAVRALLRWLHPRAHTLVRRVLAWTRLHPVAGEVPAALVDPNHPEARGLTLLALLLVLAGAAFLLLVTTLQDQGPLAGLDLFVYETLQALRVPLFDGLMVAVTEVGDWQPLLVLFATLLGWLLWQRRWHAAAHWVAAAAFAATLTELLGFATGVLHPLGGSSGLPMTTFPSAHATHSTVVYGFLAVLIGRELSERWRWLAYVAVAPLIGAIAFSRLYLGAAWLSDVLGGMALGLSWVALLGIAYRRHPAGTLSLRGLLGATALSALVATGWHISAHYEQDLGRYAQHKAVHATTVTRWWQGQWRQLPAYRQDLRQTRGSPLDVQYAGSLEGLRRRLHAHGWVEPPALTGSSWLRWLGGSGRLRSTPVLPHVHDGRHESLLMLQPTAANGHSAVALRLWHSGWLIGPEAQPLWVGTVSRLALRPMLGLSIPRTEPGFDRPLKQLLPALGGWQWKAERRAERAPGWSGTVVLIAGKSLTPR